jgi:integrase
MVPTILPKAPNNQDRCVGFSTGADMQEKSKPKHRAHGCVYLRPDSPYYRVSYSAGGRRYCENTKTTSLKQARKILDSRLGIVAVGGVLPTDMNRTTVAELLQLVASDYGAQKLKSVRDMRRRTRLHLAPFFLVMVDEKGNLSGGMRATAVTTDSLNRYVAARQEAGATNATINRELSILRRGFTLGEEATPPKVLKAPRFPRLKESAPRRGFLEDAQYDALTRAYPELWFRGLLECAKTFGWRSAELKNLRCEQVDLISGTIRLDPGSTKNSDGRVVVMTDAVRVLLTALTDAKKGDQFVFTRPNGRPVRDFRAVWRNACVTAGIGRWYCPKCDLKELDAEGKCDGGCGEIWKRKRWHFHGAIFHDNRRSACRAMVRRGIPERVAMQISGHRTRSIYDRYNITSESDLRLAARKMSEPMPLTSVSLTVASPVADKTVN